MDAEPVPFHKLHPANHRTERRVNLAYLHSLPVSPGEKVTLHLAIGKRRQHPAVPGPRALKSCLLTLEIKLLDHNRLANFPGVSDHPGYSVSYQSLRLMRRPAVGHQWHTERIDKVARSISLSNGQVVDVEINPYWVGSGYPLFQLADACYKGLLYRGISRGGEWSGLSLAKVVGNLWASWAGGSDDSWPLTG